MNGIFGMERITFKLRTQQEVFTEKKWQHIGRLTTTMFKSKQLRRMLDWEREQHDPKEALTFLWELLESVTTPGLYLHSNEEMHQKCEPLYVSYQIGLCVNENVRSLCVPLSRSNGKPFRTEELYGPWKEIKENRCIIRTSWHLQRDKRIVHEVAVRNKRL